MSRMFLGTLTIAMLAAATLPAEAAWKQYFSREAGFSFNAPEGVKTSKTAYRSAAAGPRNATVFETNEDNVVYRVTVVDFNGRTSEDAIKEASGMFTAGGKVLSNEEARVDSSYGRKMTVELSNNGGRSMSGVFFKNNRLIQLQVTVLPANGDYASPELGRFVDSLAFEDSRVDTGATELKLSN